MKKIKNYIKHIEKFLFSKKACRFVMKDWGALAGDLQNASEVINTMRFSQQVEPFEVSAPTGKLLVIAPHPDDEIIGPGGTLLKAAAQGAEITVLFLTSGRAGDQDVREAEAQAVAEQMGGKAEFLRYLPEQIPEDDAAVGRLADAVAAHGKDGVFVTFLLDDHPDHRFASKLLYRAFKQGKVDAKTPVWAYQVYTAVLPSAVVDITAVAGRKKELIALHKSQYRVRDWGHYALGINAANCRFLKARKDEAYAEIFLQVPLEDYAVLCARYFDGVA